MVRHLKAKHIILFELVVLIIFASVIIKGNIDRNAAIYASMYDTEKDFIKWVSFDVSSKALERAYRYDVESQSEEVKLNWIELLACLGNKYGGDFSRYKEKNLADLVEKLQSKEETIETLTQDMKYYDYYFDAYSAVLGGMVGEYKIEVADDTAPGGKRWEEKYGLKVFLPVAKYYPYSHFDDFGVSRSYGYRRKHLGHDMMGQVGTPIVAVESGYIEALGWNQYGGWRIGIRSFDGKRYYYYAHLRKNFPYNKTLEIGSIVQAGDVIGYLGRTGYSSSENANNIQTPHLHFGMQLIFDESQKESVNEIWIDCYDLILFLHRNRSETVKDPETKEYHRVFQYLDPIAEHYINHSIYKYDDEEFEIHIYE
jgi:murein DD-endopeptidase MepM/ murein hydrolase activator NlpD